MAIKNPDQVSCLTRQINKKICDDLGRLIRYMYIMYITDQLEFLYLTPSNTKQVFLDPCTVWRWKLHVIKFTWNYYWEKE